MGRKEGEENCSTESYEAGKEEILGIVERKRLGQLGRITCMVPLDWKGVASAVHFANIVIVSMAKGEK